MTIATSSSPGRAGVRQIGATSRRARKIWIDLDNTPHVPFFRPIIRELRRRDISVFVTARDALQVCELATELGVDHTRVGRHNGRNKLRKILGLLIRAGQFAPLAFREKPALAVSHGARSQILFANLARIPTVMIDDYEHSRHLPLASPKWGIFPEVLASKVNYCPTARIRTYPGIKEDVYAGEFVPDASICQTLGLKPSDIIVTVRPPATAAHYHNPESEHLLEFLMDRIRGQEHTKAILLPRSKQQESELRRHYPDWFSCGKVLIPPSVVDGLNLVWFSDLVVSGGGTMNREAAALGVPVYSIFCGPSAVVDEWLQQQGRMALVRNKDDVYSKIRLVKRTRVDLVNTERPALQALVHALEDILTRETDA